jgi:hypothetical protein
VLHEDHFFELAGTLTVEVEFIVTEEEAQRLLDLVRAEKVRVFYALIPAQLGILNPDAGDPPTTRGDVWRGAGTLTTMIPSSCATSSSPCRKRASSICLPRSSNAAVRGCCVPAGRDP